MKTRVLIATCSENVIESPRLSKLQGTRFVKIDPSEQNILFAFQLTGECQCLWTKHPGGTFTQTLRSTLFESLRPENIIFARLKFNLKDDYLIFLLLSFLHYFVHMSVLYYTIIYFHRGKYEG